MAKATRKATGNTKTLASKRTTKKATTPKTKATARGKEKKTAAKRPDHTNNGEASDRHIAKELGLNIDKLRILKVLRGARGPIMMADLKDGVGIGRDNKYSGKWLASVHELYADGLILVEDYEGQRGHSYTITASGKKSIAKVK